MENTKFGDRFVRIHKAFNPETLNAANELLNRDEYFFDPLPEVSTSMKICFDAGERIPFTPESK
ncbi:hypothetical protein [Endozoicomonas sp. SCSIO W0465]|uniref:hypothetical protein n=1 Tax=Endozoicomonas sp. SCSIO W0465 TaxID=2918516 RepID=UPI00207590A1|nr:hypothetical protein [Endozoicomonas sp. SCSIO W0465]USE36072.1 hypothetical protein MJO57_29170 [Endozoicomonas sp. SCSIO W0465]